MKVTKILYVEDDFDDQGFLTEAFKQYGEDVQLLVTESAIEAMHLLQEPSFATSLTGIIVDLHIPGPGGRQLITMINTKTTLQNKVLIILTGIATDSDILFFKQKGITVFIKPDDFDEYQELAKQLYVLMNKI